MSHAMQIDLFVQCFQTSVQIPPAVADQLSRHLTVSVCHDATLSHRCPHAQPQGDGNTSRYVKVSRSLRFKVIEVARVV